MDYNLKQWQRHFEEFEGRRNHFYLDGTDNITIGIGHKVIDPSNLYLVRKDTHLTAALKEVFADFDAVRTLPVNKPATFYDRVCKLSMPDLEIDGLFQRDLAALTTEVERAFIIAPKMPALVLVDMVFTMGCSGLKRKFPKFVNYFESGDAHGASLECVRENVQRERNEWARQILEAVA